MTSGSTVGGAVVDALAVYRLTRLVTDDEISAPMRSAAFKASPKLGYLVNCPHCTAVWAGLVVASGVVPYKVRVALALAAISSLYVDWTAN